MKRFLTLSNLRLALEAALLLAVLAAAVLHFAPTRAASAQAPAAPQALYWYQCNTPSHVAVFTDRVHIFCTSTTPISGAPDLTGIFWFAFPTSPDSAAASRFMSMLQSSVIAGRVIWVQADPNDTSGNSFGCGSANCRRLYGMEMR